MKLMRIRAARVAELPTLQAIERAAGPMFCDIGMPEIAQYDPWPLPVMEARRDAGRVWVVVDDSDEAVGYLIADLVDGCLQIEQVTVHPGSARRGLGRARLDHAANRAAADGVPALTLTTLRTCPGTRPTTPGAGSGSLTMLRSPRGCRRSGSEKLRWAWTGGRGYAPRPLGHSGSA